MNDEVIQHSSFIVEENHVAHRQENNHATQGRLGNY
jgi:hypothetical protein